MEAYREILEEQATGRVKEIFDDIKQTLRISLVNYIYRALAVYPEFLDLAWTQIKPNISTYHAERGADEIRAKGRLDVADHVNQLLQLGLSKEDQVEVERVIDTFNYVNPKGFLNVTTWRMSLEGSPVGGATVAPSDLRQIPRGIPSGMATLQMVERKKAPHDVAEVYDDIVATLRHGGVPSVYRCLGRWPPAVKLAWQIMKPILLSREFHSRADQLHELAVDAVKGFPYTVDVSRERLRRELGYNNDSIIQISSILDTFHALIPNVIVQMVTLKSAIFGKETASESLFSLK